MRTILSFIFILGLTSGFAQQQFEGALFMGISNYQGDLVDNYLEFGETNLAAGLSLSYIPYNKFNVKLLFTSGKLSGDDANSNNPGRQTRNLRFKSKLYEVALTGEYFFLGRDRFESRQWRKWFNPYVYMGLAVAYTESDAIGEGLPEKADQNDFFISVPTGGGFKFNIYDNVSLGLEAGFRPAFSDYLDGVSNLGNPKGNDWYMIAGVHLAFLFGGGYY